MAGSGSCPHPTSLVKGMVLAKSKKRKGAWPGGLAPVLRILRNACLQNGIDYGNGSPYVMADRLKERLGLVVPPNLVQHKQPAILWLMEQLRARGYNSAKAPKEPKVPKVAKPGTKTDKQMFYDSWEWTTLRMQILKRFGRTCMCCGAKPGNGVIMHVDHIKPLSKYWELRLDPDNLQVLCNTCNKGKGAWDETDYRPPAPDLSRSNLN